MKILIDLSEDIYTRLFDNGVGIDEFLSDIHTILTAVRKGTVVPNKQDKFYLNLADKRQLLNNPPELTPDKTTKEFAKECYNYGVELKEVFGIETYNEYVMYRDLINKDWKDIGK